MLLQQTLHSCKQSILSSKLVKQHLVLRVRMATQKLLVEYAKSNRSSCKVCQKAIAAGSVRLGLSMKDPKGFDLVKWYHLSCFPTSSHPLCALEDIKGFSLLKSCDQEALRNFEAEASSNQSIKRNNEKAVEELDDRQVKERKILGAVNRNKLELKFSLSDVKNNYKDASLPPNWNAFKTLIFNEREEGLRGSEKIAAFDFDGCLANTSVKITGADAWSLTYPSIPEKLQGLFNDGYKLVIFTNESNIERWKNKRQQAIDSKLGRLANFVKLVKVPIQVFIACGLGSNKDHSIDPFRKPSTGMWNVLAEHFNSGVTIDMDQSFYVGDAAGRVNDHSDADLKFAQAIGLKFYVPEDFFGP